MQFDAARLIASCEERNILPPQFIHIDFPLMYPRNWILRRQLNVLRTKRIEHRNRISVQNSAKLLYKFKKNKRNYLTAWILVCLKKHCMSVTSSFMPNSNDYFLHEVYLFLKKELGLKEDPWRLNSSSIAPSSSVKIGSARPACVGDWAELIEREALYHQEKSALVCGPAAEVKHASTDSGL